jgi:phosphocarrier protein HPr
LDIEMTEQRTVTITGDCGLHLRAAATLAREAARFDSSIQIRYGVKSVDAKSTLGLVTLGAAEHDAVVIHAEGDDALDAVNAIQHLCESAFVES